MDRTEIKKIPGLEILGGSKKAYFFFGKVVAMEEKGVIAIMPTKDLQVSDLYVRLLEGTGFEHYLRDGVNYIVDPVGDRVVMTEPFTIRIKETT